MNVGESTQIRDFSAFMADDEGQAVTEYILLVGLIVVPLAVAYNKLRNGLKGLFEALGKLMRGPGV